MFKVFDPSINSFSPPLHVILWKPSTRWKLLWLNLSQVWERKTLQGRKSFQKTSDVVRKREIASPFKLLVMEWMIIHEDKCKKERSPCLRVVDFQLHHTHQSHDVKWALFERQPVTGIHLIRQFASQYYSRGQLMKTHAKIHGQSRVVNVNNGRGHFKNKIVSISIYFYFYFYFSFSLYFQLYFIT